MASMTFGCVMNAMMRILLAAAGTRQGRHLEDPSQQLGPPSPGSVDCFGEGLDTHERSFAVRVEALAPPATHPRGVPAIVALEDLALVRNVADDPGQELQDIRGLGARRRPGRLVGVVGDRVVVFLVRQAAERDGLAGAVASEPDGEAAVIGRDRDAVVHVEARVRPGEHPGRCVAIEQFAAHEQPEHRAAERFGEGRDVVQRQADERPIGPEPAIGDEHMQMPVPVGEGAVGLDRGDNAHRETRSPTVARMNAVRVQAATRESSPSRLRS